AEDEGDDVTAPAGQPASRGVGGVAELLGGLDHTLAGLIGDLHVRALIEHERDCRSRDTGPCSHIRAGGTLRHRRLLASAKSELTWGHCCGTVTRVSNAYQ